MIKNEIAKFKAELKKLSRNELARLATEFYMNMILAQHQLQALLDEKNKQEQTVPQENL